MASFGEELKRERELRDISLKEIAEATKISIRFLEALEQNHFDILPGGIFNRGFIRAYARFIGIDGEEMVNAYLHELAQRESRKSRDTRAGGVAAAGSPAGLTSGVFRAEPRAGAGQEAQTGSGVAANSARATDGRTSAALWVLVVIALVVGAVVIVLNVLQGREAGASADSQGQAMRAHQRQPRAPGLQQEPAASPTTDVQMMKTGETGQAAGASDPRSLAPQTATLAPFEEPRVLATGQERSNSASASAPGSQVTPSVPEHSVRVVVNETTRVKIECAGLMTLDQELWPGQVRSVTCAEPVLLSAVNGGAVEYSLDGAQTVPLGKPGEEIEGFTVAPVSQPDPAASPKGKRAEEGGAPRAGA